MTYRDFENIQRSNEEFDGLVVLLSLWAYDCLTMNHNAEIRYFSFFSCLADEAAGIFFCIRMRQSIPTVIPDLLVIKVQG